MTDNEVYKLWLSRSSDPRYLRPKRWEELRKVILEYKVKTVLEFGSGVSSLLFSAHGIKVLSLETDPKYMDFVRSFSFPNIIFRVHNNKAFPIEGRFDLALVDGILPRLPQFNAAVKVSDIIAIDDFGPKSGLEFLPKLIGYKRINPSTDFIAIFRPIRESLKFTVVTPTLLRPSLVKACESVQNQVYKDWEHIVVVDDPSADIDSYLIANPSLNHSHRKWIRCETTHHNVGNTCRHNVFDLIPTNTDYVLYLDDDNYYINEAFQLLSATLRNLNEPAWGTFPMLRFGKKFLNRPALNQVDTGQIYHKRYINSIPIQYLAIDSYAADGKLVEWLKTITKPTVLSSLPELINMPVRSYGALTTPSKDNPSYGVIIPNRFDDIIKPLITSISKYESVKPPLVIIADGHNRNYGFNLIRTDTKFIFSHAINLGIGHFSHSDIIILNDDARLTTPNTFNKLFEAAYSDPSIGILSPLINGGCGNVYMDASKVNDLWNGQPSNLMYREGTGTDYLSFVCVYIKRQLLNDIGLLDENYVNYGRDDADFCIRAVKAGWKIAITRSLTVRHGRGGKNFVRGLNWNSSFIRQGIGNKTAARDYFLSKYPNESRVPRWPQPGTRQTI